MGRVYTKCKDSCCLWRCDIISYDVIQSEVVHVYISEGDVVWQRDTSGGCCDENEGSESLSGGSMTMYVIPELEEDSTYSITVTATNTLGSEMSVAISENTLTAGELLGHWFF